jgi:membrane protein implicated in regulation of membrane protease activity
MNWVAVVWFALMLFFIFLEASTVSLVSTWFAVGALGAMIAAICGGPVWLQCTLFFLISVALLIALRPFVKKYLTPRLVKTNVDSVIGTEGLVQVTIDNAYSCGQVKLGGMEWSARSTSGEIIKPGQRIRVDRIEGVKVFVTPVKDKVTQ